MGGPRGAATHFRISGIIQPQMSVVPGKRNLCLPSSSIGTFLSLVVEEFLQLMPQGLCCVKTNFDPLSTPCLPATWLAHCSFYGLSPCAGVGASCGQELLLLPGGASVSVTDNTGFGGSMNRRGSSRSPLCQELGLVSGQHLECSPLVLQTLVCVYLLAVYSFPVAAFTDATNVAENNIR